MLSSTQQVLVYCRIFVFLFKLFSKFHFDLVDLWVIFKNELCNLKKLHGGIFLGLAFNFWLDCILVREHLHDFSRAVTAALPACREPCASLTHAGGTPRVDRVTRAPLHVCALLISVLWNLLSFAVWSCRLILWIFERYICAWTHVHLALQVPHLSLCVVKCFLCRVQVAYIFPDGFWLLSVAETGLSKPLPVIVIMSDSPDGSVRLCSVCYSRLYYCVTQV